MNATVGQNVKVTQGNGKLTIEIDTSKNLGPSKSGKTILIATTKGNAKLDGEIVLGLNCYKPLA